MEDKKVLSDLEEDEELECLRLAALATLKKRSNNVTQSETSPVNQIQPINSISRISDSLSNLGSQKNHSWNNNAQPLRKKGRNFSKPNQRSNLIVITPVGAEDVKPKRENRAAPQLLLPQHEWCQQVNEDSSSPRTEKHTGPSRFNRHGSESESSDSDYEESDDSYSNDTVLQDEPSLLSPSEANDSTELKNGEISERRLSFQNFESESATKDAEIVDKIVSVHKSDQAIHTNNKPIEEIPNNFSRSNQKSPVSDFADCNNSSKDNEHTTSLPSKSDDYPLKSESPLVRVNGEKDGIHITVQTVQKKRKHIPIKFDVSDSVDQQRSKNSLDPKQTAVYRDRDSQYVFKDLRNQMDSDKKSPDVSKPKASSLDRNDLRFELKRKKESCSSNSRSTIKSSNSRSKHHSSHRKRSRSRSRERSRSRDRRNRKRSASRSVSPKRTRSRYDRSRHSSSQSSHGSSSSSSRSSNSRCSSSPVVNRSVSSVVKPVLPKVKTDAQKNQKSTINRTSQMSSSETNFFCVKKTRGIEIKLNPRPNFKISVPGNEQQNNGSEVKKRGPVHMRLGTLPRKRIIQVAKSVEDAFVNTSSDDEIDVNSKCKKSNLTVVTDLSDKFVSRYSEKDHDQRSAVPKSDRGKFFR